MISSDILLLRELRTFVQKTFKTTIRIFLEALRLSPNAQGYVRGSVSELLLKQELESAGIEVQRIREKWEGPKHPNHHGDFYVRRHSTAPWFVFESKGVKSNAEKWHKLYNLDQLHKFLMRHYRLIPWLDAAKDIDSQIRTWIERTLPRFKCEYADTLYEYTIVQRYTAPTRQTPKARAIRKLKPLDRTTIAHRIDARLEYLSNHLLVLETHFVSSMGSGGRRQATPRTDEFAIVCVDLSLKYPRHKFLYANPRNLEPSDSDSDHLKQNYVLGLVFFNRDGSPRLCLNDDFTESLEEAFDSVQDDQAIREEERQVDYRAELPPVHS